MLRTLVSKIKCLVFKHRWGEWYEGSIGIDFWKDNCKCERCEKVKGRGGILPSVQGPIPPAPVLE